MKNFLVLFFALFVTHNLFAQELIETDYELDAYYVNAMAFIHLDVDNNITDAIDYSEEEIYKYLILNTFKPNVFLAEASVHPMSLFGLFFRQNQGNLYEESKVKNFNIVKSITAGFEEPYSLSFFIGRMMVFKNKKESHIGGNRAYMGYLFSTGDYSIKDNLAHYDKWQNLEFKLKGTRITDERDLDWSFRVGARLHDNPNFRNSFYIGAKRSSIDYRKKKFSILYNSAFSSMIAVSTDHFYLTEAEFMIEKKWPLSFSQKFSFGLGLGYLYNSGEKYKGELKEEGIANHQLILRPNLKW